MSAYIQFGSGLLWLVPNAGNLAVNPTPTKPLTIQDVTVDLAGDIKELRGQSQFPDDTAKGDIKGNFKFAMGRKDLLLMNQIFTADVVTAGMTSVAPNEVHTIPTTPYQVTIAPILSGVFAVDLGVSFSATGRELIKVASGPTTGQYSVNPATGVYTFAAADTTLGVLITYSFTVTTAGTATYQVNNQTMGYGPQFEAYLVDAYQPQSGLYNVVHLYAAKIMKLNTVNKRADYAMPDLEGMFFASASGRVIDFNSNVG